MTGLPEDALLRTFVVFCRVAGCLMLMPGIASARIPVNVRLFLALGLTLAILPLVWAQVGLAGSSFAALMRMIMLESLTGATFGLVGRLFLLALQFAADYIVAAIGLGGTPGVAIEDAELGTPLSNLITLVATFLIFVTDLHWEIIKAVVQSYDLVKPGESLGAMWTVGEIGRVLNDTFLLALRLASPFLIYSVIVNLAIGMIGKLVPQISVYFISVAIVACGGLLLLYLSGSDMFRLFAAEFGAWLEHG